MQQRRGTAAQWTSADPVLNAGEMGWESDTNKFKVGDGTNHWADLDYFIDANSTVNPAFGTSIVFEGATADSYEVTLQATDPTADRTITLPNVTGTVITTGNLSDITDIGVFTSTIVMEGSTADAHELTLSAGNPTADRTITFPDSTGTVALTSDIAAGVVTETGTQTLTNKTLTSPVISGLSIADSSIVIEGATADAFETTLVFTDPTADRTITFPNSSFTVASTADISAATGGSVSETGTQTITNKTFALGSNTVSGTLAEFNTALSGADFATLAGAETLTNKTLTSPAINTPTGITKTDVGLANVDNTTDANKPVSTAGQTALDLKANLSGATFTGAVSGTSLTLSGDLTVNGTTTNINSTSLVVEDKNIVLADVATPSDVTADGGGITLKGATDKTFNWVDATDSWTSSEHINLASGKSYSMNGTALKDVSETLANKSISFGSNTITSTLAQLNTAISDADLASLAGTETLTNKTLSSAVLSGTLTAGGSVGTAGQVLTSTGSGVQYATPAAGAAFSELMLIGA